MQQQSPLVIGKSYCIASALRRSRWLNNLYIMNEFSNPGLEEVAEVVLGNTTDPRRVVEIAKDVKPDFAVIASEEPLARGVADALLSIGVPCVGPVQKLAQLESSKSRTRELLAKYDIPGNPEFQTFPDLDGVAQYMELLGEFVVKPDGLTGGKGVQVFGEHFTTIDEALAYCAALFSEGHRAVVIEEKLDGEEFSFQSFYDGRHIKHMIPVQDHKRALDDDTGLNTGGMGSYTCSDHLLPFLTAQHIAQAGEINRLVGEALLKEYGEEYKGILYGGFMLTKSGLRVIEYNARFGDPEVMNVLSLLETDFIELCRAIIDGTLDQTPVTFQRKASVCKYVVPNAYPKKSSASIGTQIDVSELQRSPHLGNQLRVYYSAVEGEGETFRLTDSRALAVVGLGDTLDAAEKIAEEAALSVKGNVFHRKDIGTDKLIQKRIDHMQRISAAGADRKKRLASVSDAPAAAKRHHREAPAHSRG